MLHKKATAGKTFSYNFRYANPAHNDFASAGVPFCWRAVPTSPSRSRLVRRQLKSIYSLPYKRSVAPSFQ